MKDLLYKIALTLVPKVGAKTARNLISYCGGVRQVFESSQKELIRIPGIGKSIAQNIAGKEVFDLAEKEMQFLENNQVKALFYLDEAYPYRLKHFSDSPILVYYKGEADLNAHRIVAIVGTRKPSHFGVGICEELIEMIKPYKVIIVSGLAYGVDITAHRKCLEVGIPTIGVLGHGLNHIYPAQHRRIAEAMTQKGGLLSEYTSGTRPEREYFPMRNRIVAGMCDALIVVETAKKGGSMITAKMANDYNRDVFAVPGRVGDKLSEGCNHLIKTHQAALLEQAKDIAYVMQWEEKTKPPLLQGQLFFDLTQEEKIIVDLLGNKEAIGIEQLLVSAKMTNSTMAGNLLNLEFKGLVRSLPGKRYILM